VVAKEDEFSDVRKVPGRIVEQFIPDGKEVEEADDLRIDDEEKTENEV
jgi:hypothetical protein